MKYKVGDKVKVKSGLSEGVEYCMDGELNGMCVARDMIAMGGQVVTILGENDTYYDIEEDRRIFSWADGMFEQTKKGEKNMNEVAKVYPKQMLKNMGITRVLKNKQATIVWLDDGTKGVSVVDKDEIGRASCRERV